MKLTQTPALVCFLVGDVTFFFHLPSSKQHLENPRGLQNREYMKSKSLAFMLLALFTYFSIFPPLFKKSKEKKREGKKTDPDSPAKQKEKKKGGNTRYLYLASVFVLTRRVPLTFALLSQVYLCFQLFPAQARPV